MSEDQKTRYTRMREALMKIRDFDTRGLDPVDVIRNMQDLAYNAMARAPRSGISATRDEHIEKLVDALMKNPGMVFQSADNIAEFLNQQGVKTPRGSDWTAPNFRQVSVRVRDAFAERVAAQASKPGATENEKVDAAVTAAVVRELPPVSEEVIEEPHEHELGGIDALEEELLSDLETVTR